MKEYLIQVLHDTSTNRMDGVAGALTIASLFKWLPEISAGLSIVWLGLRIFVLIRDEILNRKPKDGNKQLD